MAYHHIRDQDENGMNEYERVTNDWNRSDGIRRRRGLRSAQINNTQGYLTGNRIHHICSIQVPSTQIWNELFGNEILNPTLCAYADASIAFAEDQTDTILFAGQMEVSLIMQKNYRPGVHVAIFIIQLTPHRHFHDGHVIQREFSEGSATHQMINRLFDTDEYAVVSQATEYSILEHLADDDEMLELLHNCFIDADFNTVRFTFVPPMDPEDEDDYGQYVVDPNARDDHHVHEFFYDDEPEHVAPAGAAADEDDDDDEYYYNYNENLHQYDNYENAAVAIPPPPPNNIDIAAIYQYYYDQEEAAAADNYNVINYHHDDAAYDDDDDDELPAQG
jgi:hypothetical protein